VLMNNLPIKTKISKKETIHLIGRLKENKKNKENIHNGNLKI
jgi:hypothetical protein